MSDGPRIALVSRDVAPAVGGGIAAYVLALAETLRTEAEVVLVTREELVPALEEARAGHPLLDGVTLLGVPEVGDAEQGSYFSPMHRYSGLVHDTLRSHYGDDGPDLIEFPDYHGEGCVTLQARATGTPWLRDTLTAVRTHTSSEIVSVLNGALPDDPRLSVVHEMERFSLRTADVCLVGGGDVGGLYRRFYDDRLAPVWTVRHPVSPAVHEVEAEPAHDGPLRLVYVGRLERRKGVLRLVEELRRLRADFRLTLVGADTATGPLGLPVLDLVRVAVAGDPRFRILGATAAENVPGLVREHDVAVVPSLWECWPNTALEALACGVPVVASPVGGLVEIVGDEDPETGRRPGGWLARDATGTALRERLERLIERPEEARGPLRRATARARFDELASPEAVRDGYAGLLAVPRRRGTPTGPPRPTPRVTVVVPYFRLGAFVAEAVDSALLQTHRNVRVVVVCDGSFEDDDAVLRALASRPRVAVFSRANGGLGAARNSGIAVSTGEYVVPLDADNALHPTFVARCVATLEAHPELSYVTTWSRYVDEDGRPFEDPASRGWQPLTNDSRLLEERNLAGDAVALFRRRVFDDGLGYDPELTSFEDWFHFLRLRDRGRTGLAIPERLFDYRVRTSSMLRRVGEPSTVRLMQEMRARQRELEVEWCPWNA